MRRKIIAFYDIMLLVIVCAPFTACSIVILFCGSLGQIDWTLKYWYLHFLFAVGIVLPLVGWLTMRYTEICKDSIYFHYFPFTTSWEEAANNIDIKWNQKASISEIKSFEIVKLTEEEKQTRVYYKHWFNKYLKINLKQGNPKYVYVGNYSKKQINNIIEIVKSYASFYRECQ